MRGFHPVVFAFHCPLKADKMSTHQEKQDLLEAGEKKTMMKKMMVREPYAGLWHWWGTKSDSSPVQLLMGPGAGGGRGRMMGSQDWGPESQPCLCLLSTCS